MKVNKKNLTISGVRFPDLETFGRGRSILRVEKFKRLSPDNKKAVLRALASGRVYLSDNTNGTPTVGGIHYTLTHYGKMKDLISVSTSVLDNKICCARRLDKSSICAHCFAAAQMECYKNMRPIMNNNLQILSTTILDEKQIPVILSESGYLRGESFGDVQSVDQAANYLRIAAANPWAKFAVWTKNPVFYDSALRLELCEKTDNCNIVLSSCRVNVADNVPAEYEYFIDRVFTVYDESGIKEQNVKINCGALSCATCGKCYDKKIDVFNICEKLK